MPSGEFRHKDVISGRVYENEYEHLRQHIFNNQAQGDMMIATTNTQLGRLAKGADNTILAMGASLPEWKTPATILTDIGAVAKSLFDAHSMIMAVSANTPVVLAVAASRFVGRKASGNIAAMTGAEALAVLSGQAAAGFSFNSQEITSAKLNALVLKGTFTNDGTVVFPAFTLGGDISGGSKNIIDVVQFKRSALNQFIQLSGSDLTAGAGAILNVFGNDNQGGSVWILTPNAAKNADILRFKITGNLGTAAAEWTDITHTGFDITSGQVVKVGGTQVVSAQGAAVANPTDPASTQARLTDLLGRLRTHGLIAV